jgi:hypothetical protein
MITLLLSHVLNRSPFGETAPHGEITKTNQHHFGIVNALGFFTMYVTYQFSGLNAYLYANNFH